MENKSSNGWKFFALLFGALLAGVVGLYIYKQQNPDYDPWEEPWENSSSPVDLGLTTDAAPEADAPAANNNYLFMPDAQTVLDNVLELYLNNTVYAVLLEARVGAHAARMTAMTAATDSPAELIEDLNLEFNRARQAALTTEISEIVGGSAALKKSADSD